jgi:hypothetical protein
MSSGFDESLLQRLTALGVICGITTITAIVFAVLFFFGRHRRKDKKKAGSVTSSQATMTQDIFYVLKVEYFRLRLVQLSHFDSELVEQR